VRADGRANIESRKLIERYGADMRLPDFRLAMFLSPKKMARNGVGVTGLSLF
jgi:hypothetical protein